MEGTTQTRPEFKKGDRIAKIGSDVIGDVKDVDDTYYYVKWIWMTGSGTSMLYIADVDRKYVKVDDGD